MVYTLWTGGVRDPTLECQVVHLLPFIMLTIYPVD